MSCWKRTKGLDGKQNMRGNWMKSIIILFCQEIHIHLDPSGQGIVEILEQLDGDGKESIVCLS